MENNIDKIIEDLGANYNNDEDIIKDIYEEVSSIASDISNRKADDKKLYPYIKNCVKAEYLSRGAEGLNSLSESGKSSSFIDNIDRMRNNIIKDGLRKCY